MLYKKWTEKRPRLAVTLSFLPLFFFLQVHERKQCDFHRTWNYPCCDHAEGTSTPVPLGKTSMKSQTAVFTLGNADSCGASTLISALVPVGVWALSQNRSLYFRNWPRFAQLSTQTTWSHLRPFTLLELFSALYAQSFPLHSNQHLPNDLLPFGNLFGICRIFGSLEAHVETCFELYFNFNCVILKQNEPKHAKPSGGPEVLCVNKNMSRNSWNNFRSILIESPGKVVLNLKRINCSSPCSEAVIKI